ncbi:GyrI-like domain-containing protein [Ktedonosporobacter rubrisoli]|uniref:GyrI-like domain-containing protein n=1 Tax=Ktedonosporobacter rubrisoli TaxID=2509675 RepID=UPI0013EE7BBF|nr:GyrI-like domain-containing protein [Ktedonosporobacter rubrisoli]
MKSAQALSCYFSTTRLEKKARWILIGEAKLEERSAQPYMGLRTQISMQEFGPAIPQLFGEVFAWLEKRGIAPAGAPFIRYHVINMAAKMDIEAGVPIASILAGDERVKASILPGGRYASLVFTGVENGLAANKALLDWGAQHALRWDQWEAENGEAFGSRVEFSLTNPAEEPNPANWQTQIAIRLADERTH